jgi:uncharacterized protein
LANKYKMKKLKSIILFIVLLWCSSLLAQQLPPKPNTLVNDYLGILTPDQKETLEKKLVAYDKATSNQITIITTADIQGMAYDDYAVAIGKAWGVGGTKDFNNGIVILIYNGGEGKRKIFIATGKGLEDVVPDYTAAEIVNNEIIPYLKARDYYRALDNGTNKIAQAIGGKYVAPKNYQQKEGDFSALIPLLFLIILVVFLIASRKRNSQYMSRRGHRTFDGPPIWWNPGGGFGGFGGGGGNSGGGGGFGGFGGGDFGGGGAGGDW